MWGGVGGDPGGPGGPSKDPPPSNQELLDLKDQSENQQVLIAQLKEMIRKSDQTTLTNEKMDEYANTLTKIKARVKKSKENKDKSETLPKHTVDIPQRDKLNLLKQQIEANKVMFAERVKNQKGIEEMVTQIKAQFDDSQNLINQSYTSATTIEKTVENYNATTSSEELYNLLLTKEKNLSELNNKILKLEANVLDLQENVKEKDSVIDARTKAITLMSENLSKKGKSTLDALDDTKEQMRKMQETFIAFETQMKLDKQKLVIDLEEKSNELCIMESNNEKLLEENELLQKQISENLETTDGNEIITLQKKLDDNEIINEQHSTTIKQLTTTIESLNSTIAELKLNTKSNESEELIKLKKQLDESNKNMIKTKAQHKSKIKDLTKKIENFKKISDSNAEIVKLESEITKLNLKIAELEEEKGNLQLKIVEEDNIKDGNKDEEIEELKLSIQKKEDALNVNLEAIDNLNKKLETSECTITELQEKLSALSQLQNDQVKSEISSIDFEEKYDALKQENIQLLSEKDSAAIENERLLTELDSIKKEKQEITNKLDSYMHENMELIDKLEKLSAEKVSSAESIEIVENLTQQEKLEIEAYQKSLDLTKGGIKNSAENIDLNESVTQLNEETAELLQKIELFTIERREVMEKMENLSQDNNLLSMKLKEVEVNREMLVDTYEQLQNEKEELDNKLEELDKQNKDLLNNLEKLKTENENLKQRDSMQEENTQETLHDQLSQQTALTDKLNNELRNAEIQLQSLLSENESLKYQINEIKLNDIDEIASAQRQLDNESELTNYKLIIEDNKNELISSAKYINELQNYIDEMQKEIKEYEEDLGNLNAQIVHLNDLVSKENQSLNRGENAEFMETELNNLKDLLNENIQQIHIYKQELETNSSTISELNDKLHLLNNKIGDMEELLTVKDYELMKLSNELTEKNNEIANLVDSIKEKDEQFHKVVNDFKSKYEVLQKQIETNSGSIDDIKVPLESKIHELENKNKEQLEKMKKLAANLKKKSTMLQEMEENYSQLNEKWEVESKEKHELEEELKAQVNKNNVQHEELNSLDLKLKDLYNIQEEYFNCRLISSHNISLLNGKNEELLNQVAQYVSELERLRNAEREYGIEIQHLMQENDHLKSNLNNTICNEEFERVRDESAAKTNAMEIKIQELEMFIESQDGELIKYKEKVNKLMEGLETVEKRRLSLENKAILLGSKLEEKSNSYEEISKFEDEFEERFNALKTHDENVAKQLDESTKEYNELLERYHSVMDDSSQLQIQLNIANDKINDIGFGAEHLKSKEAECLEQIKIIENLEAKLKTIQINSDGKLKEMTNYCEKMEFELQEQQEELYKDKKLVSEQNERLLDEMATLKQSLDEQLRNSMEKDMEYEKLQNLNSNNEKIILELNELYNKTENENAESQNKLRESEKNIEALQQNLQTLNNAHEQLLSELQSLKLTLAQNQEMIELLNKEKSDLAVQLDASKTQITSFSKDTEQPTDTNVDLQTFTWPNQNINDPFNFIAESNKEETITKSESTELNTSQADTELQKKIKTLEFMLFNVEKEKDDALLQCHELSNELTRLVYERENNDVSKNLESQIVSAAGTIFSEENRKELKNIEYQSANMNVIQHDVADYAVALPVVEEIIKPQTSYLCYDDDTALPKVDAFGENDDGWGFGLEDTPLNQEHQIQLNLDDQQPKLEELIERIRVLEMERENHLEDIKQSQIKSGKLIKKLREFKTKNEQLMSQLNVKKADNYFADLDDAIQDELKTQINTLEKKIKDVQIEFDREKQENSNLNKKIDVLTSANERMVEMKEKQDIEVMSWQHRNRELQQKLDQFEWTDTGFDSPKKSTDDNTNIPTDAANFEGKINELNEIIKELTLDNDELQTLLEEQRKLRIDAERNKAVDSHFEDVKSSREYMELQNQLTALIEDNRNLHLQLENLTREYGELKPSYDNSQISYNNIKIELDELSTKYATSCQNFDDIKQKYEELTQNTTETHANYDEMKIKYDEMSKENNDLKTLYDNRIESLNNQILTEFNSKEHLVNDIKNLQHYIQELEFERNNLSKNIQDITNTDQEISTLNNEKELLLKQIAEKDESISELTINIQVALNEKIILEETLKELQDNIQTIQEEIARLKVELTKKDDEFNLKLSTTIDDLNQQWSLRVDERGSDIAESWKLHLETRENEFMQIEQQLKKEINEMEEKSNALVNENNELRKNVDAEIRNEVDRISALQQQINDRQQHIKELTLVVQEKQLQIDQQQSFIQEKDTIIQNLQQKIKEKEVIIIGIENSVTILQEQLKHEQGVIKNLEATLENHSASDNKIVTELELQIAQQKENIISLQNELLFKQSNIDESKQLIETLQQQLSEYNSSYSTLEQQLNEKDMYVSEISYKLHDIEARNTLNINKIEELQLENKQHLEDLNSSKTKIQEQLYEIDLLSQQVQNFNQNDNELLQNKEYEISNLKVLINEKEKEYEYNLQQQQLVWSKTNEENLTQFDLLKTQIQELEIENAATVSTKNADIENLQLQLEDVNTKLFNVMQQHEFYEKVAQDLQIKSVECDDLHLKLNEQSILNDEESKQLTEMRDIMEEQTKIIDELKTELYDKSTDYDALISQINIPEEDSTGINFKLPPNNEQVNNPIETADRAELDLAHYMLHQRDVRCEELTVELMQLLEERDTLQLRLSNAIKEKEELRSKYEIILNSPEKAVSSQATSPTGTIPKSKATAIVPSTDLATEATEIMPGGSKQTDSLANKLSELKSISYHKDKNIVDEQEYRRLQQLSILQQHKDEVSKLPPEAAARLVDASYTLSRDVQSPSKVLLNWLWGRSTPKINEL